MPHLQVLHVTCEYKENPLGIDTRRPRFGWHIEADARNVRQSAYQIQLAKDQADFTVAFWDTGMVSSNESIQVQYNGPELESRRRYYYRVRIYDQHGNESDWSALNYFEMGLLDPSEWQAMWITPVFEASAGDDAPCPLLRATFVLRDRVVSARAYATSLGLYELHINGDRVSDDLLTPGWTSYNKRLQYQAYDVTRFLTVGDNAVGVMLGDGWYKGELGWQNHRNIYGDKKAALLQMHVIYEDGTEEVLSTDTTWRAETGPILLSQIYHGETSDARLEKDGWDQPGFDDSAWQRVEILDRGVTSLVAQENMPVRVVKELAPIDFFVTAAGESVFDMGQNMVGYVRFTVMAPAGTTITLRHAEILDRDGNFYTGNLRSAKQQITYICKGGDQPETFSPHFTFQGFRYVKVDGYSGSLERDFIVGCVIHTDMEVTGSFVCSNDLVNRLQDNIVWGQRGNFVDVPTDCPQRDERLGWTGDAQVFIRTASFNMNVAPFFTKWLADLRVDQLADGGVPHVIPNVLGDDSASSSAWADAAVICPWTIYECFGDRRLLAEQYDSMKAWIAYMRTQGDNEFLFNTGFHFGDWLGLDAKENSYIGATPRDLIATAFYAHSTDIVAKTAHILEKWDDELRFRELHQQILTNFRNEFVTPSGRIAASTQTAHVLALWFNLVEDKDRQRVVKTLAELIEENHGHLTTGFVGTPYLCHVLSQNGYNDLAYRLLLQTDYPSWLYPVTKGATTIWEHWDSIKEDGSFWSDDMNSFNHYAYGAIGDWLYRTVAGIDVDPTQPGYRHVRIGPRLGAGLSYAKATLQSPFGQIMSFWERIDDLRVRLHVQIPANTTATVTLYDCKIETVQESGLGIMTSSGAFTGAQADHSASIQLGSGTYHFEYMLVG